MKIKIIIVSFLLFFYVSHTYSATFHALILCDIDLPDIGASVRVDQQKISNEIRLISKSIDYTLNEKIFTNDEFSHYIFDYIKSLAVEKDDIIVFYFAGHGFNTLEKDADDPWPNLFLYKKRSFIDYKDILDALEEKKPRFLLALADCCNNILQIKLPQIQKRNLSLDGLSNIIENYKNLFLKFSGKVFITSASLHELAHCTQINGGFFTKYFIEALKNNLTNTMNWNEVIQNTSNQLKNELDKKNIKQTPYFEINVVYY